MRQLPFQCLVATAVLRVMSEAANLVWLGRDPPLPWGYAASSYGYRHVIVFFSSS